MDGLTQQGTCRSCALRARNHGAGNGIVETDRLGTQGVAVPRCMVSRYLTPDSALAPDGCPRALALAAESPELVCPRISLPWPPCTQVAFDVEGETGPLEGLHGPFRAPNYNNAEGHRPWLENPLLRQLHGHSWVLSPFQSSSRQHPFVCTLFCVCV